MADITKFLDKDYEQTEFAELADAPVGALAGVSKADADALNAALNIKTIRDLATSKYVLWAQAIVNFANSSKPKA